jgi:aspartate dehydrogenase
MLNRTTCQVGLVGYGAIGKSVADALLDGRAGNASLAAVLVRDVNKYWGCLPFSSSYPRIMFTDDADTFFGCDFALLVEAAGHAAVLQYARRGLEKGADVLVVSVGVFADGGFYRELRDLAEERGRRILLASGAAGSLRVEWEGVPSESNPSTSADVPLSVIKAIRNLTSPVCLGV